MELFNGILNEIDEIENIHLTEFDDYPFSKNLFKTKIEVKDFCQNYNRWACKGLSKVGGVSYISTVEKNTRRK